MENGWVWVTFVTSFLTVWAGTTAGAIGSGGCAIIIASSAEARIIVGEGDELGGQVAEDLTPESWLSSNRSSQRLVVVDTYDAAVALGDRDGVVGGRLRQRRSLESS